ncbi:hypothetical protein OCK74_21890 [Chitinophagaceae bacterium LB-8]|uniref:Uncharacterized protein n=1 Tax=Paraflavisolibacter caeni TaxID=2982496 RepID=A0A9X2XPN5_9BACT|nr:hypothetical protein [Paraflavisolibacter caeni]MCU7551788.1 hypothetical protein [Paraflavisolibacter caeni]
MVTIINYSIRENGEGKSFVSLELQGDVEMIQSAQTGRFYATARRCTIPSTFTEDIAKTLIGKQIRGRIERVQTEGYEYTVKETGEVITLTHSYTYNPEERESMPLSKASNALIGA